MSGNRPVDRRFPQRQSGGGGGRRSPARSWRSSVGGSDRLRRGDAVRMCGSHTFREVDAGADAVMERDFRNVTRRNSPACRSATPARPLGAPDQPFGWLPVAEPSGRWIPLSMHPSEGNPPPPPSENLSLCRDSVAIVAGARSHPIRGVLPRIHEAAGPSASLPLAATAPRLRTCRWLLRSRSSSSNSGTRLRQIRLRAARRSHAVPGGPQRL